MSGQSTQLFHGYWSHTLCKTSLVHRVTPMNVSEVGLPLTAQPGDEVH